MSAWVEIFNDLSLKNFDLTTVNPNHNPDLLLPKSWELTGSILERLRELNLIVEKLHHDLSNGETTDE